jgi:hypothetical protein
MLLPVASTTPEGLHELLDLQHGVLTRTQALDGGLTPKMVEVKLRSAGWQRLQTGVYATFSGEPPRSALLWAAVLRAGPKSALSHQTAAELYGLLDTPAPAIHVTVPHGSPVMRPQGVIVHYSIRLEQARHPVLIPPRTRIEESVLDLAETASTVDQAIGVILRANASRKTTAAHIAATMERRGRMRWRRELSVALDLGGQGVHSLLEFRYVNRVERPHGLPQGRRQRPVRRGGSRQYQDVGYEGYDLVVELDGRAAHPQWSRWADIRRDNATAASGQATLRYGWADVTAEACLTAQEVGEALHQRGWDGRLRRCGPGCRITGGESG